MSLIVTLGDLANDAGGAYSTYQGGLGTSVDQLDFGATVASSALTVMSLTATALSLELPYLQGVGMGVAPALGAVGVTTGIVNLQNAETPAESLAAALGILSSSAATIATFVPAPQAKIGFTAVAILAGAAQILVEKNLDAVNDGISTAADGIGDLINDLVNTWESMMDGGIDPSAAAIGAGVGLAADAATNAPRRDPLVLDLDGDGIETTSTRDGKVVLFDHDGNGVKTGTGWVQSDDGFLVLDRNGNGTIDSGRELFGVDTLKENGQLASNGFDAIAGLDSNHNGKIDALDSLFAELRI